MSAPTIHVSVVGAATGTQSGFTNFVFEPYQQDQAAFGLYQRYSVDALAGKWWATRAAAGIDQDLDEIAFCHWSNGSQSGPIRSSG